MMKKKYLIVSLLIFSVLVFTFLVFFININFFLNNSYFKEKLFRLFEKGYRIKIYYGYIYADVFRKTLEVQDLYLEKPGILELKVPQLRTEFSFSKLIKKFKFYPKSLRLEKGNIKIYYTEEPLDLARIKKTLSKISPFYFVLNSGKIEYQTKLGWIELKPVEAKVYVEKDQISWEFSVKEGTSLLKEGYLKGRYDFKKNLSESLFQLEKISFETSNFLSYDHKSFKVSFDLAGKILTEGNKVYISFNLKDPLVFEKISSFYFEPILKGKVLRGTLSFFKDELELKVDHVFLEYPNLEGKLSFFRNSKEIRSSLILKVLNLKHTIETIAKCFSKNYEIQGINKIVKNGVLKDVELVMLGKDLKEAFYLKSWKAKGRVYDTEIVLDFLPLNLEKINGEVNVENGVLKFKGELLVENLVKGEVEEFRLDLSNKVHSLTLVASVKNDIKQVEKVLNKIGFLKESVFKNVENWDFTGNVNLETFLKVELDKKPNFNLEIVLNSQNLKIISPFYALSFYLEKLVLNTDLINHLTFKEVKIKGQDFNLSQGKLVYHFPTSEIEIELRDGYVNKSFFENLEKNTEEIKKMVEQHGLNFENLEINFFKLKDNINHLKALNNVEKLLKKISFKGEIKEFEFNKIYKNEDFMGKAKRLIFNIEQGDFSLEIPELLLSDSVLKILGKGNLDTFELVVDGMVNETLKTKIENILNLKQISLKSPIRLGKVNINFHKNEGINIKGNLEIEGILLALCLEFKDQVLNGGFNLKGKLSNWDLNFSNFLKEGKLSFLTSGYLFLDEVKNLFIKAPPLYKGEILGRMGMAIEYKTSQDPLEKKINITKLILKEESEVYFKDLSFLYSGFEVIGDGTWKSVSPQESYVDIRLSWNNSTIHLDGTLDFSVKPYKFRGNIETKKMVLKVPASEEKEMRLLDFSKFFDKFKDFPFLAKLNLKIESIELPTSHVINKIIGGVEIDTRKEVENIWLEVKDFEFCGIRGEMISYITPNDHSIFIEVLPSEGEFLDLFSCLYPKEMPRVILEGPYRIKGYVFFEGSPQKVITQGDGELTIGSKNGYLYRAPVIASILGFLSPIDIFKGKLPNLETQLLPYEELNLKGKLMNEIFQIENVFLSASGFRLFGEGPFEVLTKRLDLTFYVSPFKTIDVILEKLPGIGRWILGKPRMLIYLPLQVVGTYENYTIIPLHPSSVGKGIFDFIFRIFGVYEDVNLIKVQDLKIIKERMLKMKER